MSRDRLATVRPNGPHAADVPVRAEAGDPGRVADVVGTTLGRQASQLQDADTETCLTEEIYAHVGAMHVHSGLGHKQATCYNGMIAVLQAAQLVNSNSKWLRRGVGFALA